MGMAILVCMTSPASTRAEPGATVVFLLRHAEKTNASPDPGLSPSGVVRSEQLAGLLRDAGIEAIHSSNYIRTRDTATPLAGRLGLEIRFYDPNELESLADLLLREGGRHLVVGHSNTTPELARLLGGEPGEEIDEAEEYDRLYLITINGNQATTVLLRYGATFPP